MGNGVFAKIHINTIFNIQKWRESEHVQDIYLNIVNGPELIKSFCAHRMEELLGLAG